MLSTGIGLRPAPQKAELGTDADDDEGLLGAGGDIHTANLRATENRPNPSSRGGAGAGGRAGTRTGPGWQLGGLESWEGGACPGPGGRVGKRGRAGPGVGAAATVAGRGRGSGAEPGAPPRLNGLGRFLLVASLLRKRSKISPLKASHKLVTTASIIPLGLTPLHLVTLAD